MKQNLPINLFFGLFFIGVSINFAINNNNDELQTSSKPSKSQNFSSFCKESFPNTSADILLGLRPSPIIRYSDVFYELYMEKAHRLFEEMKSIFPASRFASFLFEDIQSSHNFFFPHRNLSSNLFDASSNLPMIPFNDFNRSSRCFSAVYTAIKYHFAKEPSSDSFLDTKERIIILIADYDPIMAWINCPKPTKLLPYDLETFLKPFYACDVTLTQLSELLKNQNIRLITFAMPEFLTVWRGAYKNLAKANYFKGRLFELHPTNVETIVETVHSGIVTSYCRMNDKMLSNDMFHDFKFLNTYKHRRHIFEHEFLSNNSLRFYTYTPTASLSIPELRNQPLHQATNTLPLNTSVYLKKGTDSVVVKDKHDENVKKIIPRLHPDDAQSNLSYSTVIGSFQSYSLKLTTTSALDDGVSMRSLKTLSNRTDSNPNKSMDFSGKVLRDSVQGLDLTTHQINVLQSFDIQGTLDTEEKKRLKLYLVTNINDSMSLPETFNKSVFAAFHENVTNDFVNKQRLTNETLFDRFSVRKGFLLGASVGILALLIGLGSAYRLSRSPAAYSETVEHFDVGAPRSMNPETEVLIMPNSLFI